MKKLGRVILDFSYVVDLNNTEMIERAENCLLEDVYSAIKYNELPNHTKVINDKNVTEEDIPEFIKEE